MLTRKLIVIVAVVAALSSAASVSAVQLANPGGAAIAQDPPPPGIRPEPPAPRPQQDAASEHTELLKAVNKGLRSAGAYFNLHQHKLKDVEALLTEMRSSLAKTQAFSERSLAGISGVGRMVQGLNARLITLETNHRKAHR